MKILQGLRLSRSVFITPSAQEYDCDDDDGHIYVRPRKCDSVRARRTTWAPGLPTVTLRGTLSIGSRVCG